MSGWYFHDSTEWRDVGFTYFSPSSQCVITRFAAGGPQGFSPFLLYMRGLTHPVSFASVQFFVRWFVGAFGW